MDTDRPTPDQTSTRCSLCREVRPDVHVNVCKGCVEDYLRGALPQLIRTLEESYGRRLDAWLRGGRFISASWELSTHFLVSEGRVRRFIADLVADALREDAFSPAVPRSDGWVPPSAGGLVNDIYERCGEGLRHLATHTLAETAGRLPTAEAERELIETAAGLRPADTKPSAVGRRGCRLHGRIPPTRPGARAVRAPLRLRQSTLHSVLGGPDRPRLEGTPRASAD